MVRKLQVFCLTCSILLIVGCSSVKMSEERVNEGNPNTPEYINEWKSSPAITFMFENEYALKVDNPEDELTLGLLETDFITDEESTQTWFIWTDSRDEKEKLLNQPVKVFGISQETEEIQLLATTSIKEIDENDRLQIMDDSRAVQFDAPIKLPKEGQWKLQTYINDELYGTINVRSTVNES